MEKLKKFLPGVIISVGVAILAKILGNFLPSLGAGTLAIFIGIALGNIFFHHDIYNKGTKFSEGTLLEFSIMFLGVTLTFETIAKLGVNSIIFVVLQMVITIVAVIFIGKKLKFSQSIYLLMASGNAVCGSSAVAATVPAIDADDESKGISITIVNLIGTVLMLLLPLVASIAFKQETLQTSALIGGVLQSVGQVVASASMVNEAVVEQAALFKILRIILLVAVVFSLSQYKQKQDNKLRAEGDEETEKKKVPLAVPWYVIAFFVACTLNSLGVVPGFLQTSLKALSGWFEIIALAAIGLRLNLKSLLSHGKELAIYGVLIGVVQIAAALGLIFLLLH